MGYAMCPTCRGQNRDTDPTCYNCGQPMDAIPQTPGMPPGVPVGAPPGTGGPPGSSAPVGHDRSSTWYHGLRSGAAAGAVFGVLFGMVGAFFGAMLTTTVTAAGLVGGIVFALVFASWVVEGIIVGVILGSTNLLCYGSDAARIGAYVGLAFGVLRLGGGLGTLWGLFLGPLFGAMLGKTASSIERGMFRRQLA